MACPVLSCPVLSCCHPHLYARFCEVRSHGDLLARVDVRVVRLRERLLQLLELRARERRADPPLLPLLGRDAALVAVLVHLVGQACNGGERVLG